MREEFPHPPALSPPRGPRRAVIDIGTNSVKLLIIELADGDARPVWEGSCQTRLGEGFYETHCLQPVAIRHTAEAVAAFARHAGAAGATSIQVIATSAARDALNQTELLAAVRDASGLEVRVISGDQEAAWAFQGVTSQPSLRGQRLLIMDLGGGSAEFILGAPGQPPFCRSYKLGCVRLLERLQPSATPTAAELARCRHEVRDFLENNILPEWLPLLRSEEASVLLVGTGGTATILGRLETHMTGFDRECLEALVLSPATVTRWVEQLWALPLEQRRELPGLPRGRADVILMGSVVYEQVMAGLPVAALRISTRGLRFAAALAAA